MIRYAVFGSFVWIFPAPLAALAWKSWPPLCSRGYAPSRGTMRSISPEPVSGEEPFRNMSAITNRWWVG